eukprot:COSAG05_NODE_1467_length_4795_cov_1.624574_1_plen_397_part_00
MLSAALLHLLPAASPSQPAVGAIYFGDWHVDVQHAELHGPNWTEFTLPIHATPRFPGHLQPNIPLSAPEFGMEPENAEDKPAAMSKKIDAAVAHGIDLFLFDWYWYASPKTPMIETDSQGPGGGTFLAGALEKGFLQAPNKDKMKFAMMWANQDWVDVHPAKRGWSNTYRRGHSATPKLPELLVFDGFMNSTVYNNAFAYIAHRQDLLHAAKLLECPHQARQRLHRRLRLLLVLPARGHHPGRQGGGRGGDGRLPCRRGGGGGVPPPQPHGLTGRADRITQSQLHFGLRLDEDGDGEELPRDAVRGDCGGRARGLAEQVRPLRREFHSVCADHLDGMGRLATHATTAPYQFPHRYQSYFSTQSPSPSQLRYLSSNPPIAAAKWTHIARTTVHTALA